MSVGGRSVIPVIAKGRLSLSKHVLEGGLLAVVIIVVVVGVDGCGIWITVRQWEHRHRFLGMWKNESEGLSVRLGGVFFVIAIANLHTLSDGKEIGALTG